MRTYYIFHIKRECTTYYKEKPKDLYQLLHHLFLMPKHYGRYGISFYDQVCNHFDQEILNFYLSGKFQLQPQNGVFHFPEGNLVQIQLSCCIVRTNSNFPAIFRTFYYYSRDLFVCDFYNQDYFWLSKHYHEIRKTSYNKIGVEKIGNI